MSHLFSFTRLVHQAITCGTTGITGDVCHFGFEPNSITVFPTKFLCVCIISLIACYNKWSLKSVTFGWRVQTLKFPPCSFAPAFHCFLPFTSKHFLCECFCHLSTVHAHPPHQHLANSSRFRNQNILSDTQHWYFTAVWQNLKSVATFFKYLHAVSILPTLSPFSTLMCFPFYTLSLRKVSPFRFHFTHFFLHEVPPWSFHFTLPIYVSPCGFHFTHFSPWNISKRFPFYTLFHREVSPCGFHFTHFFCMKYLHAVSILHFFFVKYLHVVSMLHFFCDVSSSGFRLHIFSPWSISMWFPFYTFSWWSISMWFPFYTLLREVSPCGFHFTLFLRKVSPCGFHFTLFSVKYLHVVSILHFFFVKYPHVVSISHFFCVMFLHVVSILHISSVKYLHVVSILHTSSPLSVSMWFPFYTLFRTNKWCRSL